MPQIPAASPITIRSPHISPSVTGSLTALGLLGALYASLAGLAPAMPASAKAFMIGWLAASTVVTFFVTPKNFTIGFLVGLFFMLIGWRIGGFYDVTWVWILLSAAGVRKPAVESGVGRAQFSVGFVVAATRRGTWSASTTRNTESRRCAFHRRR